MDDDRQWHLRDRSSLDLFQDQQRWHQGYARRCTSCGRRAHRDTTEHQR